MLLCFVCFVLFGGACLLFLFFGGVTPRSVQSLLLALYTRITPSKAQGTTWNGRDQTQINSMKGKRTIHCPFVPVPKFEFFWDSTYCFVPILFNENYMSYIQDHA